MTIEEKSVESVDKIPKDCYIHSSCYAEEAYKDGYEQGAYDILNETCKFLKEHIYMEEVQMNKFLEQYKNTVNS